MHTSNLKTLTTSVLRITALLLHFSSLLDSAVPVPSSRSLNVNPKLVKWPGKRVPYYIDPSYPANTKQLIRDAAKQVSVEVKGCISFVEVPFQLTEYKVKITNKKEDGSKATRCSSWPGLYADAKKRGLREQRLFITDGPTGCMDGSKHSIMKFFAIIVGKVNEHQRADRDEYIKINQANLVQDNDEAYRIHESTSEVNFYPYDYCSITHNQPEEFAKPGTEAFIVKHAPQYIPKLNRLSETDCKEISEMYGCDASKCDAMNCEDLDGVGNIPTDETDAPDDESETEPTTVATDEAFPTEPEPDIPEGPSPDNPEAAENKPVSNQEPPLEMSAGRKSPKTN